MKKMHKKLNATALSLFTGCLGIVLLSGGPAFARDPGDIDWSNIATRNVTLFYPGQSTYNWLLSPDHKKGNKKVKRGKACLDCHEDDEEDMGNLLVTGEEGLEPTPIAGKNGTVKLAVQAAHDDDYLYLHFKWKTQMNRAGRMHNMMRFDGKQWKFYGSHRASKAVMSGNEPPMYEDRLAIMLDDGTVPRFAQQGCWLTCHDSMRHMPDQPSREEVAAASPLLKKKHDIRKYLAVSRTDDMASWNALKSADEVAKLKADGVFLDLMQWRVARSNPVGMADDGYVLEYRNFDKGKKMFSWNVDKKTMIPKFMFDKAKVGYRALREDQLSDPAKAVAIIKEVNAVAYDPNAGFKAGDILPGRLLTTKTEGSAGDNDWARGSWKDGAYDLVFRRKLDTGHPQDDKILKVGGVYHMGLAIHDDNVTTRFHFVSFPLTLGIGAEADITASKLN